MKKTLLTSALFLSLSATSAFAHHPAADIVDPEIYAMIDENVADTPHADLTFDDMGRDMDTATDAMDAAAEMGGRSEQMEAAVEAGASTDVEMAREARVDIDEVSNTDAAMETITLLEDLDRLTME
jgi:hypothetical protein